MNKFSIFKHLEFIESANRRIKFRIKSLKQFLNFKTLDLKNSMKIENFKLRIAKLRVAVKLCQKLIIINTIQPHHNFLR